MATEIYVFHPGVGQNRTTDGASIQKVDGTHLSFLEQVFPTGQDKISFFSGIIVPPDLTIVPPDNILIRLVFRQIEAAGAGNIYVRVAYNNITPPTDRDSALTPLAAQALAMPGLDQEAAVEFLVSSALFASGEELIFAVERLGSDAVNDTFLASVSLVRMDVECPQTFSDVTYTTAIPIEIDHGGVLTGDTFTVASIQSMFDTILFPFKFPTFSSFKFQSGPFGGPYVDIPFAIEVGDTLPLGNPAAPNSVNAVWVTTNPTNVTPLSISIEDLTTPFQLATGLADDGDEYIGINPTGAPPGTPYVYLLRDSHSFRIWGTNTRVPAYPPAVGLLPISAFYLDIVFSWVYRRYYGNDGGLGSGPLNSAQIQSLANDPLTDGFAGDYHFASTGPAEYKYICYEAALPGFPATNFIDVSTSLNVAMQALYTVAVTNTFGVTRDFNVHRTTFPIGGEITIRVS